MLVDTDLMALLQSTSAAFNADIAATFRSVNPSDPATAVDFGSGALVSWGPGRFVNRAIGASLDPLTDTELGHLEAFFDSAGVAPSIEVFSWASPALVARLVERRFAPIRFVDVLVIDASRPGTRPPDVTIRSIDDSSRTAWSDAFVEGFATAPEDERLNRELAGVLPDVPGSVHLVADVDGVVAGCGSLYPQGRVGWVGGGATRPMFRRRGVQAALLASRLDSARQSGCDVVAATANAGSNSSRNMQRIGFALIATFVVMTRTP